jgi:polysaccharide deacetylase 2 family uncharacterized protein YibQ
MKKSRKKIWFHGAFWLLIAAGAAWVAFAPAPKQALPMVSVKVAPPADVPPPVVEAPPVGDEKVLPQTAAATPALPPREELAPAPHGAPRIAIVIDDMGLDLKDSARAIELPPAITLSFMPYATRLHQQAEDAQEAGHELLLHMPMEPVGHDDPGPGALLTGLPPEEVRARFDAALASFTGFDGVNNHMGSKFTADAAGMEIVADELQPRHLFFLDSRTSPKSVGESVAKQHGVPAIARDVFLDDELTLKSVNQQLAETERVARRKGFAVAIGHPHPVTLQALEAWLPDAEKKGFVFVPLRTLVQPNP